MTNDDKKSGPEVTIGASTSGQRLVISAWRHDLCRWLVAGGWLLVYVAETDITRDLS
jgi:hypothetical protein